MLEDFLSKLGASTRITVGVSISPNVGLEMAEVDKATRTVNRYSNKPLEYNYSSREIVNYTEFIGSLTALFEELHIPARSNIVLSMPNVHFGMISLPLLLTDEAITNAVISEVEQSYIFKRQEAVVSWSEIFSNIDTESRTLVYTAIQKNVLDQLVEACDNVGCALVGIENSYASLLKAMHFSGIAEEQMKENTSWNLMIIGQNNYSILSMLGTRILEYYEEPLALKSFVDDEIYNAITISAKLTLSGLPASYLYIVSETDLVSAEVLSMKIDVESQVKFLECNKYTQTEMVPANLNILPKLAAQISPEVVGAAIYQFSEFPLRLNMAKESESASQIAAEIAESPRINIGNLEIELTPEFIKKMALIVSGILIVPLIVLALLLSQVITPKEQAKLDSVNTRIETANAAIAKYNDTSASGTFDLKTATDGIVNANKSKLAYYQALGISVPSKLWVTYYAISGTGKVDIKGKAGDVSSIYGFYKSVKQLVNNSDIRLYKLEVASESIEDVISNTSTPKVYDFEITNMTEAELNPAAATTTDTAQANQQNQQQNTNRPLFPIFGQRNNANQPAGQGQAGPTPPATPAPTPAPQISPASRNNGLPSNLEKIEKF